ncbi:MAG: hypothetical protein ACK5XB_12740 [Rhodospirillales bacterium]
MRFFFDRNLSYLIAKAFAPILDRQGIATDWSQQKYPTDPGDVVWLADLSKEGDWSVITGDFNIFLNPTMKAEWLKSSVTTFFLRPSFNKHGFDEMHWRLAKRLPEIVKLAKSRPKGTGFDIHYQINSPISELYSPTK